MPLVLKLQFTQLTRVKARRVRAEYSRLSLLKRRRTEICADRVIKVFNKVGGIHEKIDFLNSSQNRYFFFVYASAAIYKNYAEVGAYNSSWIKSYEHRSKFILLVPDLHDSHAFFRFLVFLFCSLNY